MITRMRAWAMLAMSLLAITGVRSQDEQSNAIFQNLNAADWDIANLNGSISFTAGQLPVMVLEALVNAKLVDDGNPIAGYNDRNYKWVAEETWTFQAEFNVTQEMLDRKRVDLVLEGVDTVAKVYVNDELVGSLNNAHRRYRLPIKDRVVEGTNLVSIEISPAPAYAKMKAAEYPVTLPFSPYPRGFDNYNFIRKPASDFGWDWGPAFAPSGIYRSVELQAYDTAFLEGASIRQDHQDDGSVEVTFRASLQSAVDGETGSVTVAADDQQWSGSEDVQLAEGENFAEVKVTIKDDYSLWWPAGFGEAVLYNFTVTYTPDGNETEGGLGESSLGRRLGLRTIELVQEPLRDPAGTSFYFRVNGVPIYARGTNMIPLQIFHSQNTEAGYRSLLEDAVNANMNMIRIWGGGLYQDDSLYDLADEMGLLVWQEAMFACAQYPVDPDFLSNVKEEVAYQAQRLGHHASLAIWGANNEVETSFAWFPDSRSNPELFAVNFANLFVQTVRDAVRSVDPGVAYVDTSPSAGVFSTDPYTKRWGNAQNTDSGDVHFYDKSSNCLEVDIYPHAKFVSEYGYQSYPSFSVYKQYTELKDWSINSNMSDYRQRSTDGNSIMQTQMQFHFKPIAYNATNSALQQRLFQQWIYLTQLQQTMCYETAITNWRRLKSAPDAHTMGVLYWQLNDIWAAPSWSGIDHGGHWKLLMYGIRRFFSPVLVSATYNATQADALSVYITNDQPYTVKGTVTVDLISWGARTYDQPLMSKQVDYEVPALGSMVVKTLALKPQLTNQSLTLMDAVVRLKANAEGNPGELQAQTCSMDGDDPFTSICTPAKGVTKSVKVATSDDPTTGTHLPRTSYSTSQTVWLSEPKTAGIPLNPSIRVADVRQLSDNKASFTVSSRLVAAAVQLETDVPGIFSDNGFLLLPFEPRTLNFTGRSNFQARDLQQSLTVMSLADTLAQGGFTAA